jgi:Leucine-rich repeat (LRR) protein
VYRYHLELVYTLPILKNVLCCQYIENLDRLQKLEVLNLSHNAIQKIEKLDKLTRLRELNLSFNCIARIEHLESLTCLQVLNLTGNQIESIPAWFPKKLRALRVFKIAKNQIQSVSNDVYFLGLISVLVVLFIVVLNYRFFLT